MSSIDDEIKKAEEELGKTPRNKGTDHCIGKLKAKIAKLREEKTKAVSKKSGITGHGYSVKKTGNATVVLVGFPSVGKSTILNRMTNANSKTAAYDFTTLNVIPGVMEYKGAKIQMLDIPGIIEDAAAGKGRGREVIAVARSADLILIVVDVTSIHCLEIIKNELHRAGFRLNESPPNIDVVKKDRGGVFVNSAVRQTRMNDEFIKSVLNEFSIPNAELTLREDITPERLIDKISRNRAYMPMFCVVNKIDKEKDKDQAYVDKLKKGIKDDCVFISAEQGINMDALREKMFKYLGFVRLYLKQPGKDADMKMPLIVRGQYSVIMVAEKIHKDIANKFKFARIWGPSAKFGGQKVGPNHIVMDCDVLEMNFEK